MPSASQAAAARAAAASTDAAAATDAAASGAVWDDDFGLEEDAGLGGGDDDGFGDDDAWGDDLDDLGDDFGDDAAAAATATDDMAGLDQISDDAGFSMPTAGRPAAGCWAANSSHAADHMAAGGASSAMQLLHRQIAASDFSTLKNSMVGCYLGATVSLPGKFARAFVDRHSPLSASHSTPHQFRCPWQWKHRCAVDAQRRLWPPW